MGRGRNKWMERWGGASAMTMIEHASWNLKCATYIPELDFALQRERERRVGHHRWLIVEEHEFLQW